MSCPSYLSAPDACVHGQCDLQSCAHVVKLNDATGRWFITMGHPGFNLPANNGQGYRTMMLAVAAHRKCVRVGRRARGAWGSNPILIDANADHRITQREG